jgi:hypothetical protein
MLRKAKTAARQLAVTTATIAHGLFIASPSKVYAWLDSGLKDIVPGFQPNGI